MSAAPELKSPPYASKTSFDNYLTHLKDNPPLPTRIDKGVMSHLNYGTRQALIGSLRYLKMLTKDDGPSSRLEKFLAASAGERRAIANEMVRDGYPYLFDGSIDLARVSPHEFEEKFKAATGVNGSTADKAISFFVALAGDAGISLSPHLTKRKAKAPTATGGTRKAKRRAKSDANGLDDEKPPLPPADDMTQRLLAKFPDFDPKWSDDLKKKWFDDFDALMKRAGLKP